MLEQLTTFLAQRAHQVADVPVLQPADPFLETAGEDLRRRIFLTETVDGQQRCLRPEFTIPICRLHLNTQQPVRYAYGGTVFRQARKGGSEYRQVGLEDLGEADAAQADARALGDMLDTLGRCGLTQFDITLGDQALFNVVVESLALPDAIAARLVRNFGNPAQLESLIEALCNNNGSATVHSNVEEMALRQDSPGLIQHINQKMKAAGLSPKAGRSPQDIAQRAIARAMEGQFQLATAQAATLRAYLTLEAPLDRAGEGLDKFARETGIGFGQALEAFQDRVAHLVDRGVDVARIRYRGSFGRNLEYYTGVLFEAQLPGAGAALAGGGRYDSLCTLLGSSAAVPAVGFSVFLDRVADAGGRV